jgi:hypothetical protein
MNKKNLLPIEDRVEQVKKPAAEPALPTQPPVASPVLPSQPPAAEPVLPPEPPAEDPSQTATVVAKKALLWEIKQKNKAGRPVMRIHEPRQRFDTGSALRVLLDEVVADGGVIYLPCADFPNLYARKVDISLGGG